MVWIDAPTASAAIVLQKPNTPHSGSICSTLVPGRSSAKPAATSAAWSSTLAWAWSTNFAPWSCPTW